MTNDAKMNRLRKAAKMSTEDLVVGLKAMGIIKDGESLLSYFKKDRDELILMWATKKKM
jgi:hypothetical protein